MYIHTYQIHPHKHTWTHMYNQTLTLSHTHIYGEYRLA